VSIYKTQEPEIYSDRYPVAHNGGHQLLINEIANRQVATRVISARLEISPIDQAFVTDTFHREPADAAI